MARVGAGVELPPAPRSVPLRDSKLRQTGLERRDVVRCMFPPASGDRSRRPITGDQSPDNVAPVGLIAEALFQDLAAGISG
jgi:hypothetical protein